MRRCINGLLEYTLDWTVLVRRKVMKLFETSKLKKGKYCLALEICKSWVEYIWRI